MWTNRNSKNNLLKHKIKVHLFIEIIKIHQIPAKVFGLSEEQLQAHPDLLASIIRRKGANRIFTIVNGHEAEIHAYIKNGEVLSFNGFKGWSNRSGKIICFL